MAKRKNSKKNETTVKRLLIALVVFVLLSLLVPAVGAGPNAPEFWVSTVAFFTKVQLHFSSFWMFYSFIVAILIAYFNKK